MNDLSTPVVPAISAPADANPSPQPEGGVGTPVVCAAVAEFGGTAGAVTLSRGYTCQCGRAVYLRNTQCLACGTELGYLTDRHALLPLAPASVEGEYTAFHDTQGRHYVRCGNFGAIGCNWMVPLLQEGEAPDPSLARGLCLSCSCTRTVPDLSVQANANAWRMLEQAKRRVLSQLLVLGLPVVSRLALPDSGLAFDILTNQEGQPRVLTGHAAGVITVNAEEADDALREKMRADMHESYRTLVGHFRHEIGHYYWDVLIKDAPWMGAFRLLFGDETLDYGQALLTHYDNGPPEDWPIRFVTSYASTHPWEDWAETWAHYLHMADTVDTAMSFGLDASGMAMAVDAFSEKDIWRVDLPDAKVFLEFLNNWVNLISVLNELSRSMGQPDFYPFVLPHATVSKLHFIHEVIAAKRKGNMPAL